MPVHVAIIMDGNGRWAQRRGLPRNEGHRQGVENVRRIVRRAGELNLSVLTLYAFSCENWKRPAEEIGALMFLLERFLLAQAEELHKNRIRLRVIGRPQEMPANVCRLLQRVCDETAAYDRKTLVLALNYGSRTELIDAVRSWQEAVANGQANPANLTWDSFQKHLYTHDLPDPDLIVRTSGETRLSNFLLLQGAYSELYFSEKLWPDFEAGDLDAAILSFRQRERRFGQTGEQVRQALPPASALPNR